MVFPVISRFKKLVKKLVLSILIAFSAFNIFSCVNTAYAASYLTDKDFENIVKTEDVLKIIAKGEGMYESFEYLCSYVRNFEKIRKDCIDEKFKVFAFSGDHCSNIACNIAWDLFKEKSIYFFKDLWRLNPNSEDSGKVNLDNIDNAEKSIFFIKDTIFMVYNNYLLKIGEKPIQNLNKEDLVYIFSEACRICYCYAMDFAAYVNYFYLFRSL